MVDAKTASKDMHFVCSVTKSEPPAALAWKFHVIHPILFRGVHAFRIEPIYHKRIKFIDTETFWGYYYPHKPKT